MVFFVLFYCGRREYLTFLQVCYSHHGTGIVIWYWDCHLLCNNKKIPVRNRTITYQFCLQRLAETITLMSSLVQDGGLTKCRWNLFGSALKRFCQSRLNCEWKGRNAVFSGILGCDFIFLCGFIQFHFMFSDNYLWMIIRYGVTAWENEWWSKQWQFCKV